jgi:hypothetical protein
MHVTDCDYSYLGFKASTGGSLALLCPKSVAML